MADPFEDAHQSPSVPEQPAPEQKGPSPAALIESIPLPLAVLDLDLRIRSVNDAFRKLANTGREELEKRSLTDLASAAWGMEEPLEARLEDLRVAGASVGNFAFEHRVPDEPARVLVVRGCVLNPDGDTFLLVTIEEITAHKETERLRALAGSLFASQEDERRRVARELHDDICQKLAMLEINAEQLQQHVGNPAEVRRGLERLRSTAGALADEARQISHALHPSVIEDLGIAAALRALVEDFAEREQTMATFTAQDLPEAISSTAGTGLYRIAQEALRNAAKHAGRTPVKVILKGSPQALRLQVIDSGAGFSVSERRCGLGLIGMEERARLLGGRFRIESKPGEGTRVTVDLPLEAVK